MKATLEFNLPEESGEHLHAVQATSWYLVAWNMHQYLWKLHHDGATTTTEADLDHLNSIISDYGLSLD
jgi:hypothetical protein